DAITIRNNSVSRVVTLPVPNSANLVLSVNWGIHIRRSINVVLENNNVQDIGTLLAPANQINYAYYMAAGLRVAGGPIFGSNIVYKNNVAQNVKGGAGITTGFGFAPFVGGGATGATPTNV